MSDAEPTDETEAGIAPAPDPWETTELHRFVAERDDAAIASWIESRVAAGDWTSGYAAAAALLSAHRYYIEASRLLRRAFEAGSDPYDAARALIPFWYGTGDANLVAVVATDLTLALETIEFAFQGDDFHKGMVRCALDGIRLLANIEAGHSGLDDIPAEGIHGIALEALWKRIWMQHASLQFPSAQRLALAYVRLVKPGPADILSIVATFYGWHGGAAAGLDLLDSIDCDGSAETDRLVLALAIAFEAGMSERYSAFRSALEAHIAEPVPDDTAPEDAVARESEAERARASLDLYAIRDAIDAGDLDAARNGLAHAQSRFAGREGSGVFALPAILLAGQADLNASLERARDYFATENPPRSPFAPHILADIFARAGDWDTVYRLFEGDAVGIRAAYAGLTPGQPDYDTSDPASWPGSAVVLSGWGLGDDIFRLGLLHRHLGGGDYTMMLDARLVEMARRARPDWHFLAHTRVAEVGPAEFWNQRRGVPEAIDPLRVPACALDAADRHGAALVQEDLQAIHAARKGIASDVSGRPVLEPDPVRVQAMQDWLAKAAGDRTTIGLCWRSGLAGAARSSSFFGNAEIARLTGSAQAAWVLMQYDWDAGEIADIEARSGVSFLVHPDLDLRGDIEGVAALARACDLVMSTGVSTREICAAAGANVYSISFGWPWANAWRRDDGMRDMIFPSMMHCDPDGRESVLAQAINRARLETER